MRDLFFLLSFLLIAALFVWSCIFIPGTKAVLPEGYNVTATVLANTDIAIE